MIRHALLFLTGILLSVLFLAAPQIQAQPLRVALLLEGQRDDHAKNSLMCLGLANAAKGDTLPKTPDLSGLNLLGAPRMTAFFQGLSLGLAYVAPIGLQNLFVINSALSRPRWVAFRIAGIVIFFDILLSMAGFFGVGAIITRSDLAKMVILGVGSLLVFVIGARLVLSRDVATAELSMDMPLWKVAWMAFAVTWLNPQALLDVSLLLGAFRAVLAESETTAFILGVVTASSTWFLGLTAVTSLLKSRFTPRVLRIINLVCGLVICGYAISLALSFVDLVRG